MEENNFNLLNQINSYVSGQNRGDKYEIVGQHISIQSLLNQICNSKSDNEKIEKLKQLNNLIEQLDEDKLIAQIDNKICQQIKDIIINGNNTHLQVLLDSVQLIVERGAEMMYLQQLNILLLPFQQSGLLERIQQILIEQIKIQKQDSLTNQYSELYSKLVLIYSFINKYKKIDNYILEACGKYFKFRINKMIQILRNLMNQNDLDDQQEEQRKQLIETEIKKGSGVINAISKIAEDWSNKQHLTKQLMLHEDIVPLLHIRCQVELKCALSLNLTESEYSIQLLSSVFNSLANFSWFQNKVQQFLFDNHNIFKHLTPLIFHFAKDYFHQISKSNQIRQKSNQNFPTTLSLIAQSVHFIRSLLTDNIFLCQTAFNLPDLLYSLILLAGFERKNHQSDKNMKIQAEIRNNCDCSLNEIFCNGDLNVQYQLLKKYKYIKVLTETIGSGGGQQEYSNKCSLLGLININNTFFCYKQDYINQQLKNILIKQAKEQIIEEGCYEEIESNLFGTQNQNVYEIIHNAYRAKKQMNNIAIHQTNR